MISTHVSRASKALSCPDVLRFLKDRLNRFLHKSEVCLRCCHSDRNSRIAFGPIKTRVCPQSLLFAQQCTRLNRLSKSFVHINNVVNKSSGSSYSLCSPQCRRPLHNVFIAATMPFSVHQQGDLLIGSVIQHSLHHRSERYLRIGKHTRSRRNSWVRAFINCQHSPPLP